MGLLALGGLLVWSIGGLALQVLAVQRDRGFDGAPALFWRARHDAVARWRSFLVDVEARVPAGETILLEGGDVSSEDEFFLTMWSTYLLPRHRVIRDSNLAEGQPSPRYRLIPGSGSGLARADVGGLGVDGEVLLEGPGVLVLDLPASPGDARP